MLGFETKWKLRKVGDEKWIDSVYFPASIHEILFKKKLIPDPYFGDNEKDLKWVEESDWEAVCTLDTVGITLPVQELLIEGLSPFAKVYLNDQFVFESKNEFLEYRKNIAPYLNKNKPNIIHIVFESPVRHARELMKQNKLVLPGEERVYIRKPQYEFGWDWGPRFVLSGISKWCYSISHAESPIEIKDVFISTTMANAGKANILCTIEIHSNKEVFQYLTIYEEGTVIYHQKTALTKGINTLKIPLTINRPNLWWPRNIGTPYCSYFSFALSMHKKPKRLLFGVNPGYSLTYAICKVKLINDPIKGFYFEVNGKPLYAKGFNIIPGEHIAHGVSPAYLFESLNLNYINSTNANMLRVWGGGHYPDYMFLEWCQQNGILVWQDFMFACAMYPGDTSFINNVKEEVTQQVKRLRNYSNIALWCGNNENDEGWKNWGWQKQYNYSKADSTQIWDDYRKLFHEIIPGIVQQYDSGRSYIPSSPQIGWGHEESMMQGDSHYWGVWWGKEPIETFAQKIPRFMSEFGMQAMPDLATLQKVIPDSLMNFNSPAFKNHQKHPTGFETLNHYLKEYFIIPSAMEDYSYATQALQAFTLKTAIEAQRRAKPRCMGTLIWQLNDSWPVTSWSLVDYYGNKKLAFEEVRHSFENTLISIQKDTCCYHVYIVNDDTASLHDQLTITVQDFEGNKLYEYSLGVVVPGNASALCFRLSTELKNIDLTNAFLHAKLSNGPQTCYNFVRPNQMQLPKPEFDLVCKYVKAGEQIGSTTDSTNFDYYSVELIAKNYMPYAQLLKTTSLPYMLYFIEDYTATFPLHIVPGQKIVFNIPKGFFPKNMDLKQKILENFRCLNTLLNRE